MHKRAKSNQNFQYLTEVPLDPSKQEKPENRKKENFDLKEQFNRLHNENFSKLRKIANLKKLIETCKQNTEAFVVKDPVPELVLSINRKILEREEVCDQELAQQSILLNKKEMLKIVTDQMRGKLGELQKNFEKITMNYSAFTNSNFASKYTLLMSNKALEEYGKHFDHARDLFKVNVEKLEKRLRTASDMNTKRATRASSVDLEIKEKEQVKRKFCLMYEQRLNEFQMTGLNKKVSMQSLEGYKRGFCVIRGFVDSEDIEIRSKSDTDKEVVNRVIVKLKELEYKSESLNLTYEKMSQQEAGLGSELSKLKTELLIVKNESEPFMAPLSVPAVSVVGLRKSYELEVVILKTYFQVAEILYESLEKVAFSVKFDIQTEEKLKQAISLIKSIRIGIQKRKPFNIERFVIEKIMGKNSYYETRLEIMNSMSLNKLELSSIYSSVFLKSNKNDRKLFIDYIESSPIIKAFLDKEFLILFLQENSSKHLFQLLLDLSQSCNSKLIEKLKSLLKETCFIVVDIKKMIPDYVNMTEFCRVLEDWNIKHSINNAKHNRTQSVSAYKLTEKSHKKPSETSERPQLPRGSRQIPHKTTPRLYSLSSTAIARQKIVKEVMENQKKETNLRTIEKKISKNSEKTLNLPFMKKFILRSSTNRSSLSTNPKTFKHNFL